MNKQSGSNNNKSVPFCQIRHPLDPGHTFSSCSQIVSTVICELKVVTVVRIFEIVLPPKEICALKLETENLRTADEDSADRNPFAEETENTF